MTAPIIRPYQQGDGRLLHAAAVESRRELQPWMPWCHSGYSLEEADAWVEAKVQSFAEGSEYEFVLVNPAGAFLGACGLNQLDPPNRRANLGYWVRTSVSGRGHATAAVRLLAAWAAENTGLERLEVVIAAGNAASIRVAEKAGAFREGILRSRLQLHGVFHDAVLFSLIRGRELPRVR